MTRRAVLFDLDGTLADTAPDLTGALNRLLVERRRTPVSPEITRRHTSSGARGMLGAGFGITPEHPEYAELRDRFLQLYESYICVETVLFPGMHALLDRLDAAGIVWGVVTNKAERFTFPLLERLGITARTRCIVGGDTTARAKPHPDPLLHAAKLIDVDPGACLYVGDDVRDIQAAQAAGMASVAACYGYLGDGEPPQRWGADLLIEHPLELCHHLQIPAA